MHKKFTDEDLVAYLEGAQNDVLKEALQEDHALQQRLGQLDTLLGSMEKSTQYEPSASIAFALQEAIDQEQQKTAKTTIAWVQWAAAVGLLVVGFTIGKLSPASQMDQSDELEALMNEVKELKGLTLQATLKNHSASERIRAVNQIHSESEVDMNLLSTLVNTLNTDESPNVRYEALQALSNYLDLEVVRAELVSSLEKQSDPLIQISMITLLVNASEYGAKKPIEHIMENENTTQQVKKQAAIALKILS